MSPLTPSHHRGLSSSVSKNIPWNPVFRFLVTGFCNCIDRDFVVLLILPFPTIKKNGGGPVCVLGNQASYGKVAHLQVQNTNESRMSCNTILLVSLIIKQSCWKACIFASNCHQHMKNMLVFLSLSSKILFLHQLPHTSWRIGQTIGIGQTGAWKKKKDHATSHPLQTECL